MPTITRRQKLIGSVTAGVMASVVTLVLLLGGQSAMVPHKARGIVLTLRLELIAARDFGRLPARGTSAGQFCGAVGSLGNPDHCWQFGGSGTIADLGDAATKWDLAKAGSPRTGIVTHVPVADATGWTDWTSEQAGAGTSTSDRWGRATTTNDGTQIASFTVVFSQPPWIASANSLISSPGWTIAGSSNRALLVQATGSSTKAMTTTAATFGPGYRCCTAVMDSTGSNLGKVWCDGTDYTPTTRDFSGIGNLVGTGAAGNLFVGYSGKGNIARIRLDYLSATITDHRALCGTHGQAVAATHAAYADVSWTSQGSTAYGSRCFPVATGRAGCYDHEQPGSTTIDGAPRWTSEPVRTNRILYSGAPNCGQGWTCSAVSGELLSDATMEATDVAAWTPEASATLSKETGTPHGGTRVLRVAYNTTASPAARQTILTAGHCYRVTGWARGDASASPRVYLGTVIVFTGTSSTSWQAIDVQGCADNGYARLLASATAGHHVEFDDFSIVRIAGVTKVEDPSGLVSGASLVMAGGAVAVAGTGYTASAPLHLRAWVKVAAGVTLDASHVGGAGHWTIDGTTIGDVWTEIYSGHPAVTEVQAWSATGAGAVNITLSGGDASIWAPTLTEVAGLSVIPTGSTVAGPTAGRWEATNIDGRYWQYGDTVTSTVTEVSGTCLDLGPTVAITGQLSSECLGTIEQIKIEGRSSRTGATVILLAGQSNATGTANSSTDPVDATHIPLPEYHDYWREGVRMGRFGTSAYYGTEPFIAHTIADLYPNQPISIIKRTRSGMGMYAIWYYVWDAARAAVLGDLIANYQYSVIVSDFAAILRGQTPRKVVMVWIQGETDAGNEIASDDYVAGLDRLVDHLSTDIGHQVDQLIVSRLGPGPQGNTYAAGVLAAQDGCPAASPGGAACTTINTDAFDFRVGDWEHLTALGLQQDGNAIGAAIVP